MIPRHALWDSYNEVLNDELDGLSNGNQLCILKCIILTSKCASGEYASRENEWMTEDYLTESFRNYIRGYVDYILNLGKRSE